MVPVMRTFVMDNLNSYGVYLCRAFQSIFDSSILHMFLAH